MLKRTKIALDVEDGKGEPGGVRDLEDEGGEDIYSKRNNMYMYYKYYVLSKNFISFIAGVPTQKRLSEMKPAHNFELETCLSC